MNSVKHAVITGVGPVSAVGIGRQEFFGGLAARRSGIGPVRTFSVEKYASRAAAEIRGFDVDDYLENRKAYLDRSSQFAFAAMSLALEDAALDLKAVDRGATALALGSAYGSLETADVFFRDYLQKGPRFVKPFLFPHTYANTAISLLAIDYGLNGYHMNLASGSVASSQAVAYALDLIRQGRTALALAGGYEALGEMLFAGFDALGVLSPRCGGAEACRPFDRARNGMVLGEGAGILVIEEQDAAAARGALALAEVAGAGMAGGRPGTGGDDGIRAAIRQAMELALADAGCTPADVGGVLAAANGSGELDREEALAIRETLGSRAGAVPVGSIQSMIGDTLGAGGALRAIAAAGVAAVGRMLPTPGLTEPEPEGLNFAVGEMAPLAGPAILVNSIDPGGAAASLVVRASRGGIDPT